MIIISAWVCFSKPTPAEVQKEKTQQHLDSLKKAGVKIPTAKLDTAKIVNKAVDTAALTHSLV